jgi:hypothetical protein
MALRPNAFSGGRIRFLLGENPDLFVLAFAGRSKAAQDHLRNVMLFTP